MLMSKERFLSGEIRKQFFGENSFFLSFFLSLILAKHMMDKKINTLTAAQRTV
jgi:hypothetical protein